MVESILFPKRIVNEWNEMSADCVHSSGSNNV